LQKSSSAETEKALKLDFCSRAWYECPNGRDGREKRRRETRMWANALKGHHHSEGLGLNDEVPARILVGQIGVGPWGLEGCHSTSCRSRGAAFW